MGIAANGNHFEIAEGHLFIHPFGFARMAARMDENKPFQASKWFRLASMATMLTQHKPSEAFSRFGFGHNDNMDGRAHTLSSLQMVSTGIHDHNVDSEQTF